MTIKMNTKNIKDRLKDETLDLSLCDLTEVPVKEIVTVRKATHLDLSNNLLTSLPKNFVTINQIVKLDLSRNMITDIPENFGEMKQLKYLDLYANQISRLPLSLSELKNLRWLDLKENPLTPAVASVAGPCNNMSECQACARNVVEYLSSVKQAIEEKKQLQLQQPAVSDTNKATNSVKKEGKKKKKKKAVEKEIEQNETNGIKPQEESWKDTESEDKIGGETCDRKESRRCSLKGAALYRIFVRIIVWLLLLAFIFILITLILPLYDKQMSDRFFDYAESCLGSTVRTYRTHGAKFSQSITQIASLWIDKLHIIIKDLYNVYIKTDINNTDDEL